MAVVSLQLFVVRLPLKREVRHASHARRSTENLLARCELADGSVGWGEGVPRDYVTGETVDTAVGLLQRSDLPGQLTPCRDFAEAVALAERLTLAPVPGDARQCQGNAARCAVELALLDAYGRRFGEPLMNVTRLLAPELYEAQAQVAYSGVILSARGWKARVSALGQRLYGLKAIKVKVGLPGMDDRRRLRTIRRCVGPGVDLRVDANEAWPAAEVRERIEALEAVKLSSVEQPARHEDMPRLAGLAKQVRPVVMLDESLCSPPDAEAARDLGYGSGFNLRLSKCGGFIPTLRLAQFAAAHGFAIQLGCQVGESAILSAAGRHFATSVKGLRYREGSFDRRLVLDWLTSEDITFGRGGLAPMLAGSGSGVTIEPTRVALYAERREVLL